MEGKRTTEELIDSFADHVSAQDRCIDRGDATTGNKHAKGYIACWEEIRARGPEAKQQMLRLLNHPEAIVRVIAASYLLDFNTVEAMRVLKEFSDAPKSVGIDASAAIDSWEKDGWNVGQL